MLVFAQVHVDARAEGPAEDVVDQLDRHGVRIVARRRQQAAKDQALSRAGSVDQVDIGLIGQLYVADVLPGNIAGLPSGKDLFQLGSDLFERGVADDEQRGIVGFEPGGMPFGQVFPRDFFQTGLIARAGEGNGVCVALAIQQLRNHAQPHGLGIGFLAADSGETFLLQAVKFLLRVRRMKDEVAIDIERLVHGELERVQADDGEIEVGAPAKVGAQRLQFLADLERVARGRAFFQHALGEAGRAWRARPDQRRIRYPPAAGSSPPAPCGAPPVRCSVRWRAWLSASAAS